MKKMGKSVTLALFVIMQAVFFAASLLADQGWLGGPLEEAQAKARKTEKLLLVDFFVEYG